MVQRFREANPKIKAHRLAKVCSPVFAERFSAEPAYKFVGKKAIDAWRVTMFFPAFPKGRLQFDGANHRVMVANRSRLISECRKACTMRNNLANGDSLFAILRKFRPKLRYPR
jgi:hypothetical protein